MGTPELQLFLPRQVQEERGSPARIYRECARIGFDGPVGTACRDGHRQLKAQQKQEAARFGAGIYPPGQNAAGGRMLSTLVKQEPRGCSGNIPCSSKEFSPWEGSRVTQQGAGIPDELQGSARQPLPTQIPLAGPSRTFPARKAVPRDPQGMDRAIFPSQSPRESKRGQEDKPVKMSS